MTYDSANRLIATNNALSTPSDPRVWTREYDAAGRLIARTDANGTRIGQTYNADGQLATIDYPNGKRVTYDWTCCRMASMCDDYGRSRFTYDLANRLVSALDPTGHVVLNRYDAAGRRAALTLPDGSAYAYDYDVYGQIDSIDGTSGATSWVRDTDRRLQFFTPPTFTTDRVISYGWTQTALATAEETASSGFREVFTPSNPQMPGASPLDVTDGTLGLTDTLTVRRDLRVTSDVHTGGSTEMNLTYTYDPAGNRTGREDLLATPVTADYEYFNAANQLVGQKPVQGTTPLEILGNMIELATQPHNITVDKNGNITKIDYYSMVYVDADPGVPVDPEWQRLHTFTWNFRFDYENRLIEARGTQIAIPNALDPDDDDPAPIAAAYFNYEFGYDGLGRRVWTHSDQNNGNGSWFIYDGDQHVQERDFRSDALIVEYAWGPTTGAPAIFYQRRIVADVPEEHWIYTSPQGGFPRHLFDDTGAITDTFQYSSFGELVFHDGTTEVDFGWQGGFSIGSWMVLPLISRALSGMYIPSLAMFVRPTGSRFEPVPCWDGEGRPIPCNQEPEVGPPAPKPVQPPGEDYPKKVVPYRKPCIVITCTDRKSRHMMPPCCKFADGSPCFNEQPTLNKCLEEPVEMICNSITQAWLCDCDRRRLDAIIFGTNENNKIPIGSLIGNLLGLGGFDDFIDMLLQALDDLQGECWGGFAIGGVDEIIKNNCYGCSFTDEQLNACGRSPGATGPFRCNPPKPWSCDIDNPMNREVVNGINPEPCLKITYPLGPPGLTDWPRHCPAGFVSDGRGGCVRRPFSRTPGSLGGWP